MFLGLTCLAVTWSACNEKSSPLQRPEAKDLPDDRTWTSQHFRYHTRRSDGTVCEGIVEQLEMHFDALQSYLGFTWPAGQRIEYYKFTDDGDKDRGSACSSTSASCFFADTGIQTAHPFELHELVHAYLAPLGRRHIALEEGLADALSCAHQVRAKPEPSSLDSTFQAGGWGDGDYSTYRRLYDSARWFVGWLLNTHGGELFLRFYERTTPELGLEEADAVFLQIYGSTLADAWRSAFNSSDPDTACARVFECATPRTAELALSEGNRCELPFAIRTLDLSETNWVFQQSSGSGAMLGACPGTPAAPHRRWLSPVADGQQGESFAVRLPAGSYFVAQSPRFSEVSFNLYKPELGLTGSNDCSEVIPLPLDFRSNFTLALHASDGLESQRVQWQDLAVRGKGYRFDCAEGTNAEWCDGCGSCASICDSNVAVAQVSAADDPRTLRLSGSGTTSWGVRLNRTF